MAKNMPNNQQPVVLPAVLRPSLLEVFGFWYVDSLFEGCFSTSPRSTLAKISSITSFPSDKKRPVSRRNCWIAWALLGSAGLAAGLSAKKNGIYTVAIQFKDGKRSLLEVDDKIYKAIISKTF